MSCDMLVETRILPSGQKLDIYYDDGAESPREWGNLGIMTCQHDKYSLGDEPFDEDRFEENMADMLALTKLYTYEHGCIKLYMADSPHTEHWDTGHVGFIYTTAEKIREIYGDDLPTMEQIVKRLRSEVETYSQYLNGEVYRYVLSDVEKCSRGDEHETEVDACCGFYSIDDILEHVGAQDRKPGDAA